MHKKNLVAGKKNYIYFDINDYARTEGLDIRHFPVSLKILLENLVRNSDSPSVTGEDIRSLASWNADKIPQRDIAYHPARVVMQDFTGVPAVVDLAAMRDNLVETGGDGSRINPKIPVDLVIDHSVMVDNFGSSNAFDLNVIMEFKRNSERYRFLKWGQTAFDNFRVVPPGTGIIHQVNLEYLARVVWTEELNGEVLVYPDTLVGTDSHTTMINGLGVLGWGVGGIEAEAAMLGQPVTMLIPEVVGFRLDGRLSPGCTATDLVLAAVKRLREYGVVGKFVEFFGEGLNSLSLADRATISNMAPEYGATCGMFPIDNELLAYLRLTGRDNELINLVETYAKVQGLWRDDNKPPTYSSVLEFDMSRDVAPAMAGPKRPQDLVALNEIPENFRRSLHSVFSVPESRADASAPLEGLEHNLKHGDVAIAAITSCTNTSNPAVLIAAGLLARKARERGIMSKPWVKTSFAPGSQVVTAYLEKTGLANDLDAQGFQLIGYGCTTCIGNSGPLPENVSKAISDSDLVTVNVLSGNRNFEGRVSPNSKASYLGSPPLVVAYALTGTVLIDFETEPLGKDGKGRDVYLRDVWPSLQEIHEMIEGNLSRELFHKTYGDVFKGPLQWQKLEAPSGDRYDWEKQSTYIRRPPFFEPTGNKEVKSAIKSARILAILPDSTTTDHISPAGVIPVDGPAGLYLKSWGIEPQNFNSFGSRRGNHEVMMRGTFANIRIHNAMAEGKEGGYTRGPDGKIVSIYDAAMAWMKKNVPLIVLAGKEYGTGSSRDWAGKGPMLQGVAAVIAESYERIHRSNLIGMGILPLQFVDNGSVAHFALDGSEELTLENLDSMKPHCHISVRVVRTSGESFEMNLLSRIDTAVEMDYWRSDGILNYVLKKLKSEA